MSHLSKALLCAALAGAALAPAADAAIPKTGIWRGDNTQVFEAFLGGQPLTYKTTMVMTELDGRIKSVVGYVRMECPAMVGVRDARILKSWSKGRGPKVSSRGAFTFWANGAYFHGRLTSSSIMGGARATYGSGPHGPDCSGTSRFNLQHRR
jgi:hypothetical protein